MGEYFILVNPNKRQFLNPSRFDEGIKASGIFHGYHGLALMLLLCDTSEISYSYGTLRGAWCGDRIYAAGDEHGADLHGFPTAVLEDPERNLNTLAHEEYQDISYAALAMLCEDPWTAGALAKNASSQVRGPFPRGMSGLLADLGNAVLQTGCVPLETALEEQFGGTTRWQRLYVNQCAAAAHMSPSENRAGIDSWNSLWALPPATRIEALSRAWRMPQGPAFCFGDARQVVNQACDRGYIPLRVEARLREGETPTAAGSRVIDHWTPGEARPGDDQETYLTRASEEAVDAIDRMEGRLAPDLRDRVRYSILLHGGEPSWRSRLPWPAWP